MVDLSKYTKALDKYLEQRTKTYQQDLLKVYKQLLDSLLGEVSSIYLRYEKDGQINYNDLLKYKRLDKLKRKILMHVNTMSKTRYNSLSKHLRESSIYSYDWMTWAIQKETSVQYESALNKQELERRALENRIAKLTLKKTLQRQRKRIIQRVNQTVDSGIKKQLTYKEMSEQLKDVLDKDRVKSMRIVRTETHRIREEATHESAKEADANGIVMHKKWLCLRDERVRSAHNILNGQKVPVSSRFEFAGFTALTPGGFGVAHLDINCRCILVYTVERIVAQTDEQVAKRTFEQYREMV